VGKQKLLFFPAVLHVAREWQAQSELSVTNFRRAGATTHKSHSRGALTSPYLIPREGAKGQNRKSAPHFHEGRQRLAARACRC
jgi:hypothetical protein